MASPSSPGPPTAVPLPLPPPPPPPSSRRLPPPCWSPDETVALIDAYRDKWYSLGRGNLKAPHWQEVADAVVARCPNASPPKTAVQCRHKMEKLRKRYRTEIQRARTLHVARLRSSWVHFKLMDSMEKGPSPVKPDHGSDSPDEIDGDDQDFYEEFKNGGGGSNTTKSFNKLYRKIGIDGFRIRIPSIGQPVSKLYGKFADHKYNNNNYPNSKPRISNFNCGPNYGARVLKEKRERDPVGEMVCAIKVLGDGFVRMEQMKMEMAREIESMRMEMEMKRTEMILESQQRIVEAFAKAVSEKKKKTNRMASSTES